MCIDVTSIYTQACFTSHDIELATFKYTMYIVTYLYRNNIQAIVYTCTHIYLHVVPALHECVLVEKIYNSGRNEMAAPIRRTRQKIQGRERKRA